MFEHAKWICLYHKKSWGHLPLDNPAPCPYMIRDFVLTKPVRSVLLHASGLGQAAYYLNGVRIPGSLHPTQFTSFHRRVVYNTFDLTALVRQGRNRFGAIVGHINFAEPAALMHMLMPMLIAQIDITYEDGSFEAVVSDSDFKVHESPIRLAYSRCGEKQEGAKVIEGWSHPDTVTMHWNRAAICAGPGGAFSPAISPTKILDGVLSAKEIAPGVYDFGEHIAGYVSIKLLTPHTEPISVIYSEWLTDDGQHVTHEGLHNLRFNDMRHRDLYLPSGKPNESFEPLFTYHGFRYVEVSGIQEAEITAVRLHTDLRPVSEFSCDHPILNSIHLACRNSIFSCAQGTMVDCPQREQNEWTGDAMVVSDILAMEYDVYAIFTEMMRKYDDDQFPDGGLPAVAPCRGSWTYVFANGLDWSSAIIHLPYYAYQYTGDLTMARRYWDNMERAMTYFAKRSDSALMNFGVGDWISLDPICNIEITDTAYYRMDALMMAEMAEALGYDSTRWTALAEQIRKEFRFAYVHDGELSDRCFTAIMMAVESGMLTQEEAARHVEAAVDAIISQGYCLRCGVHGLRAAFHVLGEYGYHDVVYRVLTNTQKHGYGKAVADGFVTLPERYDYRTETENRGNFTSVNHYFTSMVDGWFFRYLAGIQWTVSAGELRIAPWISDEVRRFRAELRGITVERRENLLIVCTDRPFVLSLQNKEEHYAAGTYQFPC